jgi:hypothetical protein
VAALQPEAYGVEIKRVHFKKKSTGILGARTDNIAATITNQYLILFAVALVINASVGYFY